MKKELFRLISITVTFSITITLIDILNQNATAHSFLLNGKGSSFFETTETRKSEIIAKIPKIVRKLRETRDCPKCNLNRTNLAELYLRQANLYKASLREADLSNADLQKSNLQNSDLRGANLSNANLHKADLSSANLKNANLTGANLSYANLSKADLRNSKLGVLDIYGSNLREANLQGIELPKEHSIRKLLELNNIQFCEAIMPDGEVYSCAESEL
ncbi:MAG: pentapeptide repeat-containing protein [Xenococcaceae cyanobacterium MO_167.B52]|nr:pentapeptide repeat-containing protein [Xenococcaceae cyanobacterium MO_167.B52]